MMIDEAKEVDYSYGKKDMLYIAYWPRSGSMVDAYIPLKLVNYKSGLIKMLELALGATIGAGRYGLLTDGSNGYIVTGFTEKLLRDYIKIENESIFALFEADAIDKGVRREIVEFLRPLILIETRCLMRESNLASEFIRASLCLVGGLRESKPIILGDVL